jgi:hypothetical protein
MSAPPGTSKPAPANPNTFILGGAIAGIIVLCGGLFANSLITLNIVTRNADVVFKPGPTQPETPRTTPSTSRDDDDRGKLVDENSGSAKVAHAFLNDLKGGDYSKAWNRGTDRFKNNRDLSEFRKDMETARVFRGFNKLTMTRSIGGQAGATTFNGFVEGGSGSGRFVMEVVQEDDGTWRVDEFNKVGS